MADWTAIMQHVDSLNTVVAGFPAAIDETRTEIQALKDQIANGIAVTQADLDALDARLTTMQTDAQQSLDNLTSL